MNPDSAPLCRRIVFFGDSVSFGQGISPHRNWVTRLAAEVERRCGDGPAAPMVHNVSINGNTTRQALERMAFDVQSHGVDMLVLQFGLNDANYWLTDRGLPRVSQLGFVANLTEIIERAVRFGARAVQLHTNHPVAKTFEAGLPADVPYAESNRRYNERIREVAERMPGIVGLIDIEARWSRYIAEGRDTLAELLLPDGVHLSNKGHDLYYEIIASSFLETVTKIYQD
jgi:lysophospholipase L1-like esterase